MNFIAKLSNLLNRVPAGEEKKALFDSKESELRLHARYSLLMQEMMEIDILSENISACVCDISYGGALLELKESDRLKSQALIGKSFDLQLKYLGAKCRGSAMAVHVKVKIGRIGISFEHNNTDTLVFLRDILEYMRIGSSLISVNRSLIKKDNDPNHMLFRGDSPTDLQYHKKNDSIDDLILTYRQGDNQLELRYTPEGIFTSNPQRNQNDSHTAVDNLSRTINQEVLRNSISILAGFNAIQRDTAVEKIIYELMHKFPN